MGQGQAEERLVIEATADAYPGRTFSGWIERVSPTIDAQSGQFRVTGRLECVQDGGRVRLSTRRGSAEVAVEISERMLPGHVSLPNGLGLDFPDASGGRSATGVAPNELTRSEDRDWLAGTPWHKHTPARVEAL